MTNDTSIWPCRIIGEYGASREGDLELDNNLAEARAGGKKVIFM